MRQVASLDRHKSKDEYVKLAAASIYAADNLIRKQRDLIDALMQRERERAQLL